MPGRVINETFKKVTPGPPHDQVNFAPGACSENAHLFVKLHGLFCYVALIKNHRTNDELLVQELSVQDTEAPTGLETRTINLWSPGLALRRL